MDAAYCALSGWNYRAGTWHHIEYKDEPRRVAHYLHAVRCGTDFGYETGTAVFVAYLIFIVLQIVLLKGKFRPFQLLQVAASYLTSAFITIFDRVLPVPEQMGSRLLVLALAIILTGIGAAVTVDVNIVPNPADGLARVLGERCGKIWDSEKSFRFLCPCHLPCYRNDRCRTTGGNRKRHCCSHGLHGKSDRAV